MLKNLPAFSRSRMVLNGTECGYVTQWAGLEKVGQEHPRLNLGPLGKLQQTITKENADWVSLPLSIRHGQSQGKVIQESLERKLEN